MQICGIFEQFVNEWKYKNVHPRSDAVKIITTINKNEAAISKIKALKNCITLQAKKVKVVFANILEMFYKTICMKWHMRCNVNTLVRHQFYAYDMLRYPWQKLHYQHVFIWVAKLTSKKKICKSSRQDILGDKKKYFIKKPNYVNAKGGKSFIRKQVS